MTRAALLLPVLVLGCDGRPPQQSALGTSPGQPIYHSLTRTGELVRLSGAAVPDPIHLNVTSNSSDASYRTTWTLAPGSCLHVVPRIGEPVTLSGQPMVADYYHFGRMLGVAIGEAPNQRLLGFGDPIGWQTTACPTATVTPAAPAR